jgi:hypothetical protein
VNVVDRVFGWLMVLGGIGHGLGSYKAYSKDPMTLLWALSASFAVFLLAAMNLLRAGGQADPRLAWICAAGCVVQIGFALRFGVLIGNVFDFRPLINAIVALILFTFSVRTALQARA